MIEPNSHVAAMAPYALADLEGPAGKPLNSLAQNESVLPPSPKAITAGRRALETARLYCDAEWTDLRAAIARVHHIPAEQILCGAGSMELIASLARCYAGPGGRVLSSQYGYGFFRSAALAVGAAYDQAPERGLTVSVDDLLGAVRPETRLVFVANPGNPTGTRIGYAELVRLRDGLDGCIALVIDEAYGEFAEAPGEAAFGLVGRGDTVVLRSFSKAYGLAGLRVGWGLFPPAMADQMRKVLNPNNVSGTSQASATAAMDDQSYMLATVAETTRVRDHFIIRLRNLGLETPDSSTNFVLIRFADADGAARADQTLREEGVIMRRMTGYGLADCLRATVASEAQMDMAADCLALWCQKEGLPC
ncbi:MAG: histidinol-phosphate transaminase [Pseudomonadota bacterium]|nr:histidinol-phosphate transaminase [Pseudomonadota bacterium]